MASTSPDSDTSERTPGGDEPATESATQTWSLSIPETATAAEAAAIVAAIDAHLQDRAAAATAETTPTRSETPWTLAGRIDALAGTSVTIPESAPRDAWTAASRSRRF